MKMKKFTLIELLLVVALIGILTTLLMPSISKARSKARQQVCLSNQRQVHLATTAYMVEENRYGPRSYSKSNKWISRLKYSYINDEAFVCPEGTPLPYTNSTHIAMNNYISGKHDSTTGASIVEPKPLLTGTPNETCLLTDSYKTWSGVFYWSMTDARILDPNLQDRKARHDLKANITYLDGHSISVSAAFLKSKSSKEDTFWDPEQ